MNKLAIFVAGASMAALAGTANAATSASCTNDLTGMGADTRVITLTTAPDGSCFAKGDGNINGNDQGGNADPIVVDYGYIYLDSTDPTAGPGAADGALSTNPLNSGTSGTFSINAALVSGYTDFLVGLKTGDNFSPSWAVFTIGALTGNWSIGQIAGTNPQTLSHAILYGKVIPLPPAALLFGTALAGVGFMSRRKKAAA